MKKIFLIIIILSSVFHLYAQKKGKITSQYGFEINKKPHIYYDAFISYQLNEWQPQLVLKLSIVNDVLQFTKKDEEFLAGFDVSLSLIDNSTQATVLSDLWQTTVKESDFVRTNSSKIYQIFSRNVPLNTPPGLYNIYLELTDTETGKVFYNKRELLIPQFSDARIKHSTIRLINNQDNLTSEIVTEDNHVLIEFNSDLTAIFELETVIGDSLLIHSELTLLNEDEKHVVQMNKYHYLPENKFFIFKEKFKSSILKEGDYQLSYKIFHNSKSETINKKFSIVWFDKPLYLYKADLAFRPMKYIIPLEEWENVDALSSDDHKIWFRQYWEKQDPNPETPLNEIQYEFYIRVDEANKKFSLRFKEGWETDRGKTLILYGSPDEIQSNRYVTSSAPSEVWFYNQLKQKITFIDQNKDGNYKLVGVEDIGDSPDE